MPVIYPEDESHTHCWLRAASTLIGALINLAETNMVGECGGALARAKTTEVPITLVCVYVPRWDIYAANPIEDGCEK
jgi:hypothetical protein